MSIEINRARVMPDGSVTCEMVFPNIGSFSRATNEVLRIEAEAFAPREPTAPPITHADAVYRAKVAAAERATGRNLPANPMFPGNPMFQGQRPAPTSVGYGPTDVFGNPLKPTPMAHMPPFVDFADSPAPDMTVLGGNAYPPEEPQGLKAGEAYEPHELKAGGTSSDDED